MFNAIFFYLANHSSKNACEVQILFGGITQTTLLIRLFAAVALAAFSTHAQAANWTVKKTFGQVWAQSSGVQKVPLARGAVLKGKTTIITGKDGKAVLARNTESMIIGPYGNLTVPGPNFFGRTTIRQNIGTVIYDVEKRNVRHFAVKTPTLTAVVKGTTFQVEAKANTSKVSVREGSVRVSDRSTGESADVSSGEVVTVSRGSGEKLSVAIQSAQDTPAVANSKSKTESTGKGKGKGKGKYANSGSAGDNNSGSGSSGSGSSGSSSSGAYSGSSSDDSGSGGDSGSSGGSGGDDDDN